MTALTLSTGSLCLALAVLCTALIWSAPHLTRSVTTHLDKEPQP